MKIGIDISQTAFENTGVARFMTGLSETILKENLKDDWTFFYSSLRKKIRPELKKRILTSNSRLINLPLPPSLLSLIWNNFHLLSVESLIGKFDWFITSDWTEPPAKAKKATIIHDLVFKRYPETVDPLILKTQEKRLHWVCRESSLIVVDSNATKSDLLKYYKIDSHKVHVIYPGVTDLPSNPNPEIVKSRFKLSLPFLLTVGKIEPRKNIKRLIEAFEKSKIKNVDLVIVGSYGWGETVTSKNKNVKFITEVTDSDLAALYQSCLAFIFPSLYEGFGYPLVEAMKLGAPVATSNTSSMLEIANGTAVTFDPINVSDMSAAISKIVNDEKLRRDLSEKSRKRSRQYSWDAYYKNLMTLLKSL